MKMNTPRGYLQSNHPGSCRWIPAHTAETLPVLKAIWTLSSNCLLLPMAHSLENSKCSKLFFVQNRLEFGR